MTATITDTDHGLAALGQRLAEAAGFKGVLVGILADEPHEGRGESGPASLVEIAAINEFGAPGAGIPSRPFIRGTIDANAAEIQRLQAAVARAVIAGRITPEQALQQIGARVAGMIKAAIARGGEPPFAPNAESTILAKGSSKPLVDTGTLRSAVSFEVQR